MKIRCLAIAALVLGSASVFPQNPDTTITAVEEDWVVYIKNPDPAVTAPQIVNVISPVADTDSVFGIIELNHASQPSFHPGGAQVQAWNNDQSIDVKWTADDGALWRSYDKLEYTVRMEIKNGKVCFTLKNGRSKTWGRFATTGVTASVESTIQNLSEYSPEESVSNTSINVGVHRVALMYQRECRKYNKATKLSTDTTARLLHRFSSVVQYVSLDQYRQNSEYYNIKITEDDVAN